MSELHQIFTDVFISTMELRLEEDIPQAEELIRELIISVLDSEPYTFEQRDLVNRYKEKIRNL